MIPPYKGVDCEMYPTAADFKKYFDTISPAYVSSLLASWGTTGNYSAQIAAGTATPVEVAEEMQKKFAMSAKTAGLPGYQD